MVKFIGLERPARDLNSYRWRERLLALLDNHPGEWAKYGPYNSVNAARRGVDGVNHAIRSTEELSDVLFESSIQMDEEEEIAYLYLKLYKDGDGW